MELDHVALIGDGLAEHTCVYARLQVRQRVAAEVGVARFAALVDRGDHPAHGDADIDQGVFGQLQAGLRLSRSSDNSGPIMNSSSTTRRGLHRRGEFSAKGEARVARLLGASSRLCQDPPERRGARDHVSAAAGQGCWSPALSDVGDTVTTFTTSDFSRAFNTSGRYFLLTP